MVCCEISPKHINTICGQTVEFLMLNMLVQKVTTKLRNVNTKNNTTKNQLPVELVLLE